MSIRALKTQQTKLQARLNDLHNRQSALDATAALTLGQIAEAAGSLSSDRIAALAAGRTVNAEDHATVAETLAKLEQSLSATESDRSDTQAAIRLVSDNLSRVTQSIAEQTDAQLVALAKERVDAAVDDALRALTRAAVMHALSIGEPRAERVDLEGMASYLGKKDLGRIRENGHKYQLLAELRDLAQGGGQ